MDTQQSNEDKTCAICLENLDDKSFENGVYKIKECGHRFHTDCFLTWCKQTVFTCPLCRINCVENLNFMDKKQKYQYLRKISLRKDSPPILKELANKCRTEEKMVKQLKQDLRMFKKENKIVFESLSKKRGELYRQYVKYNKSKDSLVGFPIIELPQKFRVIQRY